MLEIRTNCEQCGKNLPNTSEDAMICTFECTYCKACALESFENVCPSCGGNFEKRPIRTKAMLKKYGVSDKQLIVPKEEVIIQEMKSKYKHINPKER
jgi:hypothetical protein